MPNAKARIGRAQLARARANPPAAPNFQPLSNEDVLKLSKAGAKNLVEGTREENRQKEEKGRRQEMAAKLARTRMNQTTDSNN